jgi:HEAT repeat protein
MKADIYSVKPTRSLDQATGLIEDLHSPKPETRARAARALANTYGPQVVGMLIAALGDTDDTAFAAIKEGLMMLRPDSIPPLLEALNHEFHLVRSGAAELLGDMRHLPALEKVRALLQDPVGEVRGTAGQALVRLEGRNALNSLAALLEDPDALVRLMAVKAVAAVQENVGAGLLAARLLDYDPEVKRAAIKALREIGDRNSVDALLALQNDPDPAIAALVQDALIAIGERAVGPFIEDLNRKEVAKRMAAFESLVKQGKAAVLPLLAMLDHRSAAVRRTVAELLGTIGDARALPGLARAVRDKDRQARMIAVAGLGNLKSAGAVEVLLEMLTTDDQGMNDAAGRALAALGTLATDQLVQLLESPERELRVRAAQLLGLIRDMQAFHPLIRALQDPWYLVRAAAATSLGNLLDPQAADPLLENLHDEHPAVRAAVAGALGQLRELRATEPLLALLKEPEDSVREAVVRALGRIGDPAVIGTLVGLLKDRYHGVRAAAITALGSLRVGHLLEEFQRVGRTFSGEHSEVRRAARRAVIEIRKGKEDEHDRMKAEIESKSDKVIYH